MIHFGKQSISGQTPLSALNFEKSKMNKNVQWSYSYHESNDSLW